MLWCGWVRFYAEDDGDWGAYVVRYLRKYLILIWYSYYSKHYDSAVVPRLVGLATPDRGSTLCVEPSVVDRFSVIYRNVFYELVYFILCLAYVRLYVHKCMCATKRGMLSSLHLRPLLSSVFTLDMPAFSSWMKRINIIVCRHREDVKIVTIVIGAPLRCILYIWNGIYLQPVRGTSLLSSPCCPFHVTSDKVTNWPWGLRWHGSCLFQYKVKDDKAHSGYPGLIAPDRWL